MIGYLTNNKTLSDLRIWWGDKPTRTKTNWKSPGNRYIKISTGFLPNDLFAFWFDEPIEVELTITRV